MLRRSSAVLDCEVNLGLGVEDPEGGFEAMFAQGGAQSLLREESGCGY